MYLDLPRPGYAAQLLQPGIEEPLANELGHPNPEQLAYAWAPGRRTPFCVSAPLEQQVEELAGLPENWDGYGALPINAATKYNALSVLPGLLAVGHAAEITPNPNGTLSFEWETADGCAHLEIGQSRLSFYITSERENPLFLDCDARDLVVASTVIGVLVSSLLSGDRLPATPITEIRMAVDLPAAT